MPKHTTNDPGKRAFHIAQREAEQRYKRLDTQQHLDGHTDSDYYANTVRLHDQTLQEMCYEG